MKKVLIITIFACLAITVMAQDVGSASAEDSLVLLTPEEADQMPKYVGGVNALLKFLRENLKYPNEALKYKAEGQVEMWFFVDTDGTVKDISASDCKIERIGSKKFYRLPVDEQSQLKEQFALLFAEEGVRVIRSMPNWIPGELNGKPIRVKYKLPLTFKLD